MEEIGVKELKHQLSAVLRRVQEKKEPITITSHGHPVARLVPVEDDDALWAELDRLALEVDRRWKSEISAAEAVSQQRR
jgi:prevent-host-death family protein